MTDCGAPRHKDQAEPTPAEPAARLCKPCRLGLAADLRRLPHLDHHLSVVSLIAATPGNGSLPLPFDADVSEWRSWFRRNITRTTITIAGTRKWRLPQDHPWAMCAWLEPQVRWMSFHDWAPMLAGLFHPIRVKGEQLAAPFLIKRIPIGACLACGNSHMMAVIYADHHAGRWSYWVCPVCHGVTQIEHWWDYAKRTAAAREQVAG